MAKKFVVIILLGLILVGILPLTVAQEENSQDWEVGIIYYTTFDFPTDSTPNVAGVAITSPAGLIKNVTFQNTIFAQARFARARVSPDYRYLMVLPDIVQPYYSSEEDGNVFPYIQDIQAERCCHAGLPIPHDAEAFTVSSFSPDGSQIAIAYAIDMVGNYLGIVDVATGELLRSFERQPFWVLMEWTEQGIYARDHCTSCDTSPNYTYSIINPETGEATDTQEWAEAVRDSLYYQWDYNVHEVDRLEVTGEVVRLGYDDDFPPFRNASGSEPYWSPNVVEYYSDGLDSPDNRQVIYTYPEYTLDFPPSAYWVMDGQAVLLTNGWPAEPATLIYRDGTTLFIDFWQDPFVAGTPDGWLTQNYNIEGNAELVHHTVVDGQVVSVPLEIPEAAAISLAKAPELGHSITERSFTSYPVP